MSELRQTDHSERVDDQFAHLEELIAPAAVQVGDSIKARVIGFDGAPSDIAVQVMRMSPLGVEFALPAGGAVLAKGTSIDLALSIGGHSHVYRGLIVASHTLRRDQQVATIRLVQFSEPRRPNEERRGTMRWMCSEQFFPTAIAANPARFNDYVYFTMRDLSRSGARLVTSLRNKFVMTGMRLECLVSFPLVAQTQVEVAVKNVTVVHERGKDMLSVGVEFVNLREHDLSAIAQYLIQFGDPESLEALRAEGLVPVSLGRAVEYSFVRTREEYEEVLDLRRDSYGGAGKIANELLSVDMADPNDAKSRILIGKYHGRIVASARLFFPQYGDVLEQEEYVTWPPTYGRRDEFVEVMRVCTHDDFRRSDLLFSLFRFVAITALQAKRYKVVGCATDSLLPLYTKIGFRDTGLSYNLPLLNNLRHSVIFGDARRSILGLDVGPIVWNVLWKDTIEYVVENGLLAMDAPSQLRLMIYRAMAPLAYVLQQRSRKPRRIKDK
jgi:predicted GNAT family N-acyltransferase